MKESVTVTLITERWQASPPEWKEFRRETVEAKQTAKRVYLGSGIFAKVFDLATGREITRHRGSWYKHRIEANYEQPEIGADKICE